MKKIFGLLVACALGFAGLVSTASAQSNLPVSVAVSGNTATVVIGNKLLPIADMTITFDEVSGLTPASLGIRAQTVSLTDLSLLQRLPDLSLTTLSSSFPVLITVEPPANGGLVQHRVTRVEVHTHALPYTSGSPLRLFKAQLNGPFRDITESVKPGSVRTRGTTPGWSQFLVLPDLRPTSWVIKEKFTYLRNQLDGLPASERAPLENYINLAENAVADKRYADALVALDALTARVSQRAGTFIPDEWRATRDTKNIAGELMSAASTLSFSIGFLRDYKI